MSVAKEPRRQVGAPSRTDPPSKHPARGRAVDFATGGWRKMLRMVMGGKPEVYAPPPDYRSRHDQPLTYGDEIESKEK